MNYGLRWDDYGNPYSRTPSTIFGNFIPRRWHVVSAEQIANGAVVPHHHALNRSITDVFSPRAGIAYSPDSSGQVADQGRRPASSITGRRSRTCRKSIRGNPPGNIFPVFYGGQDPAPVFGLGTTNNEALWIYAAPTLPARALTSKGGIEGLQFNDWRN